LGGLGRKLASSRAFPFPAHHLGFRPFKRGETQNTTPTDATTGEFVSYTISRPASRS
jgi:hypothetical protein